MMSMPKDFYGYVERTVRVSSTSWIGVAQNRYSVPCERAGQWGIAEQAQRYIQLLYETEDEVRDMEPDFRCRIRQEKGKRPAKSSSFSADKEFSGMGDIELSISGEAQCPFSGVSNHS